MEPPNPHHIHLMGICGAGMASLAGILKQEGCHVTGSDQNIYPPMSDFLEGLSIPILEGYSPKNLNPIPDLVIVGNVITKYNPEAIELSRLNIPYLSLPQALRRFAMEDKRSIVVCGTHGKTTTSALAAWILQKGGMDPGFMVGGIPNNFPRNFKLGKGPFFVIEGDEYDTAFFDKGPKFLHYNPWITILTSIEFDHADIYRDLNHVIEIFRKLINLIPPDGLLIANGDDPVINTESREAKCPVITYGFGEDVQWRATDLSLQEDQTQLRILKQGKEYMKLFTPLYGRYNISNLLSTVALSDFLNIDHTILLEAMKGFKGIRRRQEVKGEKRGVSVLDDFAHHPTAVRETIQAVKEKYKSRRVIAVFEPRSNSSRRNIFQEKYAVSFDLADLILIPEPPLMEKIPPAERFSSIKLVEDLKKRGLKAFYCPDTNHLLNEILRQIREGDIILIMSNGPFDNLPQRVMDHL
ncbi:MAG: UDP-N-acetylmuramate:L-alanyl-gamma-D-glutamyl-meso-diaminopimelate ligase [Deltaproteobacteria bacterium]|nr:MAG: UDP-N-acetylmuramate:L-alanyl-gamma-D-glutamyl-meso-diaminopimelate ligase [Deltaproteobacteria bacterium]